MLVSDSPFRECLLFDEMCAHLLSLGFRCIDLVRLLDRPLDDSFWQTDLVFVKYTCKGFDTARFS